MRAFFSRCRDLLGRRRVVERFDEELAFHFDELKARLIREGCSEAEAERQAHLQLGNASRHREQVYEQAGFAWLDALRNDVTVSWRALRRRPFFLVGTVAVLSLGLGTAIAVYQLVDIVMFRPLAVPAARELHGVQGGDPTLHWVSRGTAQRLEALLPSQTLAAFTGRGRGIVSIDGAPPTAATLRLVNGNFFRALGVGAEAGRLFESADDAVGQARAVAVAGHAWAVANFGTPAAAVGRELLVNRTRVEIIGVLPASFRDVAVGRPLDLWFTTAAQPVLNWNGNRQAVSNSEVPNDPDWNRDERISWLSVLLRTREPGPVEPLLRRAIQPELDAVATVVTDPEERTRRERQRLTLVPCPAGDATARRGFAGPGLLLGSVVGVMLLLTWVNVSGLVLVRAMARGRELAVRLALGAGRRRVGRLTMVEALLLSAAGVVGGLVLASWLLPLAARWLVPGHVLALDLRAVAGAIVLGVLTTVAASVAPLAWIARLAPGAVSLNSTMGRSPVRVGRWLVATQFALAVVLVAIAHSLASQLRATLTMDPGIARRQLVTAAMNPAAAGYREAQLPALRERLREAALSVPGVTRVTFAGSGVMVGSISRSTLFFRAAEAKVRTGSFQTDAIEPGFFATTGTPFLRGRDLTTGDTANTPRVAIVTAALARQIFGEADPLGQRFGFGPTAQDDDWTIVGVVADARTNGVHAEPPALAYLPLAQSPGEVRFVGVQFEGVDAEVRRGLRAALGRAEPGLMIQNWRTIAERIQDETANQRSAAYVAGAFALSALVLAATGVAASLGYMIMVRQRELALRMALGAEPTRLVGRVLRDAALLALAGSVPGLVVAGALPLAPAFAATLQPLGLVQVLAAVGCAVLAAMAAAWLPALRAARIDPNLVLKAE